MTVPAAGLVVTLAVLLSACGADAPGSSGGSGPSSAVVKGGDSLVAQVASYDLAAGGKQRFIVGLLAAKGRFVSYGHVAMSFSYLGRHKQSGAPQPGPRATGHFLEIPGDPNKHLEGPVAVPASQGRGVYGADVSFDKPGFWQVSVSTALNGGPQRATAAFQVLAHHHIPAIGRPALRTKSLTLDTPGVPRAAIDSRGQGGQPVPDPELHKTTIADSIKRHQPALVVFATPVYCISQFCGPITNMVDSLAKRYSSKANFIHVEIWRNFNKRVLNKSAADWLYRDKDLHEPWVFLIGANGRIVARWDNVATAAEIEPYLQKLPRMNS